MELCLGMRDYRIRLETLKVEDGCGRQQKKREPSNVRKLTGVLASAKNERSICG
jgi:hypothetical protein